MKRGIQVGGWLMAMVLAALAAACDGEDLVPADQSPAGVPPAPDPGIAGVGQSAFGTGSTDVGRFYQLRNVSSGFCMDVENNGTGNGVRVLQWDCASGENQSWYFRQVTSSPNYQLSARHSARCLRADGGSTGDVRMEQDSCGRVTSRTDFVITRVGSVSPPQYQIKQASANKCVRSPDSTRGSEVVQRTCGTSSPFLWTITARPDLAQSDATGRWSQIYNLPLVPAAAALLPNKRVLVWSSWRPLRFGGSGSLDQTSFAVWNPASPTSTSGQLVTNTVHNMFCPGIALLADGRVFVNGGDDSHTRTTSIYDWRTNAWTNARAMIQSRWYNSSVTLADGRVFTLGGNRTSGQSGTGEIWTPASNTWDMTNNLTMGAITSGQPSEGRAQEHPRLHVAPNGKIFIPGPTTNMQWYDPAGEGTITGAGSRTGDEFSQNDITVLFDVTATTARILKAGGNPSYDRSLGGVAANYVPSSHNSYVITVTGMAASVSALPPMKYPRAFGNGVVLANGQVVAAGGLDNAKGFSDDGAPRAAELFDPATNTWTELAPMVRPRPYHSVALLLADGRVLVGGGGLCSSSDNCAQNHPDIELLSPPYLFPDANRPGIPTAPAAVTAGGTAFTVSVSGTVTGFSLVRSSGVTHSVNTDQRFMRLAFTGSGGTYAVTPPANRNVAPPGYYMLFALNGQQPSREAAMVQVQ